MWKYWTNVFQGEFVMLPYLMDNFHVMYFIHSFVQDFEQKKNKQK